MLGMEMMMKSLGLDPTQIRESVEQFGLVVIAIKEQLDRIEAQNARIEKLLIESGNTEFVALLETVVIEDGKNA